MKSKFWAVPILAFGIGFAVTSESRDPSVSRPFEAGAAMLSYPSHSSSGISYYGGEVGMRLPPLIYVKLSPTIVKITDLPANSRVWVNGAKQTVVDDGVFVDWGDIREGREEPVYVVLADTPEGAAPGPYAFFVVRLVGGETLEFDCRNMALQRFSEFPSRLLIAWPTIPRKMGAEPAQVVLPDLP